jgi:hypothetical protein
MSDRQLVLSYHQIRQFNKDFVGPRRDEGKFNGRSMCFTLLGAGYVPMGTDWALITTEEAVPGIEPGTIAPIDFNRTLARGDRVFALGFGAASVEGEIPPGAEEVPLMCVPGTVLRSRGGLVYLETDLPILPGMSGGPAVVWDRDKQKWIVIGINASRMWFREGPFLLRALKIVRPQPPK